MLALRIAQGTAGCVIKVTVYSMGSSLLPDRIKGVATLFEAAVGVGFSSGPAIGSVLYHFGGFCMPFFVMAFIFLALALVARSAIPESADLLCWNADDGPL